MAIRHSPTSLSRRTALASALGLVLATHHSTIVAQNATPATSLSTEDHLLVGAWAIDSVDGSPLPNNRPEWAVFSPDGTWVRYYFEGALALGAWQPTGERTAAGVEIYALFTAPLGSLLDLSQPVPNPALEQPPLRFRFDVELDASGNALTFAGVLVDEQGEDHDTC